MYQRIFTTTMNFIVPNSSAKLECVEFRENNSREHYARLVLGPVAPGQGVTLGNTFRRLLLNDLPGVAITAAKLNQTRTEFTTIPGIRESVVEIFLNLRDIVFFNTFPDVLAPQGTITIDSTQMDLSLDEGTTVNTSGLKVYKPRVICAGDMELPEGVHCVDPTQPIATLVNGETPFHLTFILEQATGYRVWKKPTQPYGTGFHPPRQVDTPQIEEVKAGVFQPIDGNFMPVKVVNFTVHDGPPHGEYIHFEITTNGSITPEKALSEAAQKLMLWFSCLSNEEDITPEKEIEPEPIPQPEVILIEELQLPVRAYNCLKRAGINSVDELVKYSQEEIKEIKNFGKKSADEVFHALKKKFNIVLPSLKQ